MKIVQELRYEWLKIDSSDSLIYGSLLQHLNPINWAQNEAINQVKLVQISDKHSW